MVKASRARQARNLHIGPTKGLWKQVRSLRTPVPFPGSDTFLDTSS